MKSKIVRTKFSLRMLSCTKFRPGLSELKTIPFPVLRSTYSCPKVFVPASILSCTYLYSQLEQAHFSIIYPLGFQNASCKGTSRTESICLKDTLVTGALLRNSATWQQESYHCNILIYVKSLSLFENLLLWAIEFKLYVLTQW